MTRNAEIPGHGVAIKTVVGATCASVAEADFMCKSWSTAKEPNLRRQELRYLTSTHSEWFGAFEDINGWWNFGAAAAPVEGGKQS